MKKLPPKLDGRKFKAFAVAEHWITAEVADQLTDGEWTEIAFTLRASLIDAVNAIWQSKQEG